MTSNHAILSQVEVIRIWDPFHTKVPKDIYLIVYGMIRSGRLIIRGPCVVIFIVGRPRIQALHYCPHATENQKPL